MAPHVWSELRALQGSNGSTSRGASAARRDRRKLSELRGSQLREHRPTGLTRFESGKSLLMGESRPWNVSPTLPASHTPRMTRPWSPALAHRSLPVAGRQRSPPRRVSLSSSPLPALSRCRPSKAVFGHMNKAADGKTPPTPPARPAPPAPRRARTYLPSRTLAAAGAGPRLKGAARCRRPSPAASQPLALRSRCLPARPRPPRRRSQGRRCEKEGKPERTGTQGHPWRGGTGGLCPGRRQHCQDTPGTRGPFSASLPKEPRGKWRCRGTRRCAGLYLCPPQPAGTPRLPRQGPGAF